MAYTQKGIYHRKDHLDEPVLVDKLEAALSAAVSEANLLPSECQWDTLCSTLQKEFSRLSREPRIRPAQAEDDS
jgi:hypothetical protein